MGSEGIIEFSVALQVKGKSTVYFEVITPEKCQSAIAFYALAKSLVSLDAKFSPSLLQGAILQEPNL